MSYHNKRNAKRQSLINICITLGVVLVGLLVVAVILTFSGGEPAPVSKLSYHQVLTVEVGTANVKAEDFLKNSTDEPVSFETGVTREQLAKPGVYELTLICGEESYKVNLKVLDTVAPTGKTVDLTTKGTMLEPQEFVTDIQDACDVTVSYKTEPDLTVAGVQEVVLILADTSGNKTELTAKLTVELDQEAPVISGAANILAYQGDAVSYRRGITVTDNEDDSPSLTVDNSQVDLSTPGTYTLIYIATDAAGNESRVEVTVEVREKQPYYVDLAIIYEEVDELLEDIVTDGMTKRQQEVHDHSLQAIQVALTVGAIAMNDEFGFGQSRQLKISQRVMELSDRYAKEGEGFLLEKMAAIGFLVENGRAFFAEDDEGNVAPSKVLTQGGDADAG